VSAKIIDGKAVAAERTRQIAEEAKALANAGRPVQLVAVQVGEDPASKLYTDMQARQCEEANIRYELRCLPEDIRQQDIEAEIGKLNVDPAVSGLILQMPLPAHLDTPAVQLAISPNKDVEGIHPVNLGRLLAGGHVAPCTPLAAVELLRRACPELGGKELVIVGRSDIVGKPLAIMLLHKSLGSPTVTVCHSRTADLAYHTRRAEVLIAATGYSQMCWQSYRRRSKEDASAELPKLHTQAGGEQVLAPLITAEMLGEGQIIIDVATNRVPKAFEDGKPVLNDKGKTAMRTMGDVDPDAAAEKAAAVTPVPGGVGPVTVAMLLKNTLACAKNA